MVGLGETERWLRAVALVAMFAMACEDAPGGAGGIDDGASGAAGESAMVGNGAGAPADDETAPQYVGRADSFTPLLLSEGGGGEGGVAPELPLGPPYGTSTTCDDAIVGEGEECDDGDGGSDACTADCKTRDQAVGPAGTALLTNDRYLGAGRHPVSGLDQGFITTYVDASGDEPAIGATLFNIWGQRAHSVTVSEGASPIYEANPVAAALPDGSYAVAWGDFDGDGSDLGVALRRVEADGTLGGLSAANAGREFSQLNPDVLWTGSELVVAWEDYSDAFNGPDLRYRTFDAELNSTSGDLTLAASGLPEAAVALAPFSGGWVAAYREGAADGGETIVVKVGAATFRLEGIHGGPLDDRPALVELDETHLLVVFSAGVLTGTSGLYNTPRLQYSVIDVEVADASTPAALEPLDQVFTAETQTAQLNPSVTRSEQGVYVAWRSEALPGDAAGDQVWLKFLRWQAGDSPRLDAEQTELLIPRTCDGSFGDQRRPTLAQVGLPPGGALAIAWEDYGRNESNGEPEVVLHYAPTHLTSTGEAPRVVTETWSGATGSSWPAQWSSSISGPVQLTTQYGEGEFNAYSLPGNSKMWINDHTALNVDLVTTIRLNSYVQFGGMFARRADDDDDSFLSVSFSSRTPVPWRLYATINGQAPMELDSYPLPMAFSNDGIGAKIDHRLRFRVLNNPDGTIFVGMRTWRVGAVEPTTWLMEAVLDETSDAYDHFVNKPGRFGVLGNVESANGGLIFYDDFRATFFEGAGAGDLAAEPDLPLLLRRDLATYRRCNENARCEQNEGCCSDSVDCAAGLACTSLHARSLGLGSHASVCVADHCADSVHNEDETRADCGGADCPACGCTSTVAKGSAGYCTPPCLCGIGDYPCAKSAGCLPGLICGEGAADPFGGAFTDDACVPAHCMNRVRDADKDESAPDYGGPCGSDPNVCTEPNGAAGHCRVYCPCTLGQGACRADDECAAPLRCTTYSRGSRFGLPNSTNICLPAHCFNNIKDTALGETSIDCGNECGCQGPCAGAPCPP